MRGLLPVLLLIFFSFASAKLSPSEIKTLFRIRAHLEFPPAMAGWTNSTDFCSLPSSPSLTITCSGVRVSELSVSGTGGSLSPSFSVGSFFTTLSRLPSLTSLSLVTLGIWGSLPSKMDRLTELKVLNMSWNHLYGPIPWEISKMADLRSLVLKGNAFNGSVPDIKPLSGLQELDLSENQLHGVIPAELKFLWALQTLDLSSNRITGSIPEFLFSLPSIENLDLAGNALVGALPENLSCAASLRRVDISENHLTGALPWRLRSNDSNMVVIDSGNCITGGDSRYQRPSSFCNQAALAAVLPPSTVKQRARGNHLGLIFGVVFGAIGGAAVLGAFFFLIVMRRAKKESSPILKEIVHKPNPGGALIQMTPKPPSDARRMAQAMRIGTMGLTACRVFTMEELEEATNSFDSSRLVGDGRQGELQIYKGWLRDGTEVEIRSMKLKQGRISAQSLAQYSEGISKLRHRNIVSILGHCVTAGAEQDGPATVLLVFERVSNGTLRSHLTEWRKREMLKWPQRVTAAIGVARGIQFLHTVTTPGIVRNDLRIEHILLDETLTAKISNYNLPLPPSNSKSKMCVESSFGAAASETDHFRSFDQGQKDDVFQMGIILLEIITGQPPGSQPDLDKLKLQLTDAMNMEGSPSRLREVADPAIRGTFADDSLRRVLEVAVHCVSEDYRRRPSIDDVLWNLQYSVQIQDGWASCDTLSSTTMSM